jgi:DNA polymerase IV (DinB-like DNA polymerase)
MQTLKGYADSFEQVGIDEAYLDITQKVQDNFDLAENFAKEMKLSVQKQHGISFSVGVGPNKLVAKIACDSQKPDGLTIVKPELVKRFLQPLPVDRLLGVGRKTGAKMEALGIKTIGDLANYDMQKLVEVFGKNFGVYFHKAANGIDNEPVQESGEAESISRIGTLKENTRDLAIILEKTDQLIADIKKEVTQRKLAFKQVGIIAIMTDLTSRSRSQTLETSAGDEDALRRTVRELVEKFLDESEMEIRRVGVKVSHFTKEEKEQKQLTNFLQNE